jgi:hypothetical protein
MDDNLFSIWEDINTEYFAGELTPVRDIGWLPLSDETEGIEAFGIYFSKSHAIDERFEPDGDKIRAGDKTEEAKLEVAHRLVLHETVHQAQHQWKLSRPGGHGVSFVEVATPIATKLGIDPPTEANAGRWPELRPLLAAYGL